MAKNPSLKTAAGRSKFAEESAAAAAQAPANTLAVTLFGDTAPALEAVIAKAERRNMPQMVKPGDVPVGSILSGVIVKIVDSPVSTVKGKLLWLRHETGQEFTFPVTGVIRNALAPGIQSDDEKLSKALEKEVGKMFIAKRLPGKASKYKKEMFMFDVYTVEQ